MIEKADWRWFGHPGHFICAFDCRFHLCTQVGEYLVSTVGEYFPDAPVREIYAESRKIILRGRGDERKYDYLKKIGYEEVGCGRKYETMVFKAGEICSLKDCKCGLPSINGTELAFSGYDTAGEATRGHLQMCERFANKQ